MPSWTEDDLGTTSQSRSASREVSGSTSISDAPSEVTSLSHPLVHLHRSASHVGNFHYFTVSWSRDLRLLFRAAHNPDIPLQEFRNPPNRDLSISTRECRRLGSLRQVRGID